jgi:hypothetical protein
VNNNDRDAAGNVNTVDQTGGGKAAQAQLDAANEYTSRLRAADARNNSYQAPAAAMQDPGWTVDPVTGRAVPPSR